MKRLITACSSDRMSYVLSEFHSTLETIVVLLPTDFQNRDNIVARVTKQRTDWQGIDSRQSS
jgi:hypothetical protein